jgi:hypothetical protein
MDELLRAFCSEGVKACNIVIGCQGLQVGLVSSAIGKSAAAALSKGAAYGRLK